MGRIVAVRHGETDWNRHGRMQGWAPVPLNDLGRAQARAAGASLATEYDFDRVLASDLLRTRQTAELLCEAGVDPSDSVDYDPGWRERDLGVYQGLERADVAERFPEFALGDDAARAAHRTPEGGESLFTVADRVTDRFDRLPGDETVLVVTHGGPITVLLGHAKEIPIEEAIFEYHLENCSITEFDAETADVVRENVVDWELPDAD